MKEAPEPPATPKVGPKTKGEARLEARQVETPVTQSEEDKLSRKQRKQGAGTDQKPSVTITSEVSNIITVEEQKQVAQVSASREQLLR